MLCCPDFQASLLAMLAECAAGFLLVVGLGAAIYHYFKG